jgi:hypothetical protein
VKELIVVGIVVINIILWLDYFRLKRQSTELSPTYDSPFRKPTLICLILLSLVSLIGIGDLTIGSFA